MSYDLRPALRNLFDHLLRQPCIVDLSVLFVAEFGPTEFLTTQKLRCRSDGTLLVMAHQLMKVKDITLYLMIIHFNKIN